MAREMNSLFLPNPPIEVQHRRGLFSLQDFPPISVPPGNFTANLNYVSANMPTYQNQYASIGGQRNCVNRQIPPLMEPPQPVQGYGTLTWLSSKGGLITSADGKSISFQAKEFCDEALNDLSTVLRVGFTLKYNANHTEGNQYTATQVAPVYGEEADQIFASDQEIDLEKENPTPPNSKDAYSLELELMSYEALLATFERQNMHKIQLSSMHNQMSNNGDEKLFRYVGTSSMKRRQFVERRTHVFCLQNDDTIHLQYPAVYQLIIMLSSYLLRRGGIASVQCLFNYYASDDIPKQIKDFIGFDRQVFVGLLQTHSFAFAVFPNRYYVSARRNLPKYDYIGFVNEFFPNVFVSQQRNVSSQNYPEQGTSAQPMRDQYEMQHHGQNYGYPMQQRPQQQQQQYQAPLMVASNGSRQMMHSGNHQQISPHSEDNWTSLNNLGTWSNQSTSTRQPSRTNSVHGMDPFGDRTLINEFGQALRVSEPKVSTGVQVDVQPVGGAGCICKCSCGKGGNRSSRSSRSPNTGSSVGAIGPSLVLPIINPGVNNFGTIGSRDTRPSSMSTASSEEQPTYSESYNLFGPNDVLCGSFDSLRFGNF
ncbi:unnamed protein product [Caenorhabditis brenneri]